MTDSTTLTSPPLPPEKARFLTESLQSVQGFLESSTALYLGGIEAAQRGKVPGGIAEIGVHRGKSFIAMIVGLPEGDEAVAIDIFDAQHLNLEATSVNALRDFKIHLERFGLRDRVDIVEGSSLELEKEGFLKPGRRFRLFSVDGGHLAHHVLNDLRVAEATLVEGGVVAADDLLHPRYLGVITGVFQYLDGGGTLAPYALVPNKLLLTDPGSVGSNKAMMRELFGAALAKADVPFHRSTIDVYGDRPWTVLDTEGRRAPLQRPRTLVDELHEQVVDLQEKLAKARANAKHPARHGRADVLPKPLRRPARAIYQRVFR
jgi:Methyltransferase domain